MKADNARLLRVVRDADNALGVVQQETKQEGAVLCAVLWADSHADMLDRNVTEYGVRVRTMTRSRVECRRVYALWEAACSRLEVSRG